MRVISKDEIETKEDGKDEVINMVDVILKS